VNYNSNFWSSEKNVCVVEADEYDRSFLKLDPNIAVITAMDADHLDIYGTAGSMEQAFIDFSEKVREGGLLLSHFGLKREKELAEKNHVNHLRYALDDKRADVYARNIRLENGSYEFDLDIAGEQIENLRLNMGGMHNIENAIAAITIASSLKIDKEKIKAAVENFRGVKRRFEYVVKGDELVFIDDYAHHPEELKALIKGAKGLFPGKTCTVIFQPHLFTRTRDLAEGFAQALDLADDIILLPVYPAREQPIAGVSSEMILKKMTSVNKRVMTKEELMSWIKGEGKQEGKVLITAGAGDIDMLVEPIKEIIKN
jgi:UDP-N-acetylmuramate--alanine ligase